MLSTSSKRSSKDNAAPSASEAFGAGFAAGATTVFATGTDGVTTGMDGLVTEGWGEAATGAGAGARLVTGGKATSAGGVRTGGVRAIAGGRAMAAGNLGGGSLDAESPAGGREGLGTSEGGSGMFAKSALDFLFVSGLIGHCWLSISSSRSSSALAFDRIGFAFSTAQKKERKVQARGE